MMIEKILEAQQQFDEIRAEYREIHREMNRQKEAHPRSYKKKPEWEGIQERAKNNEMSYAQMDKALDELTREYAETLMVLDENMVNTIREKAKASEKHGYWLLSRCAINSRNNFADTIEMDEIMWENEADDFIAFCEECGVTKLAITDDSTALQRTLLALLKAGWKVTGTYTRRKPIFDSRVRMTYYLNTYDKQGVLMERIA